MVTKSGLFWRHQICNTKRLCYEAHAEIGDCETTKQKLWWWMKGRRPWSAMMIRIFPSNAVMERGTLNAEMIIFWFLSRSLVLQNESWIAVSFLCTVRFPIFIVWCSEVGAKISSFYIQFVVLFERLDEYFSHLVLSWVFISSCFNKNKPLPIFLNFL